MGQSLPHTHNKSLNVSCQLVCGERGDKKAIGSAGGRFIVSTNFVTDQTYEKKSRGREGGGWIGYPLRSLAWGRYFENNGDILRVIFRIDSSARHPSAPLFPGGAVT